LGWTANGNGQWCYSCIAREFFFEFERMETSLDKKTDYVEKTSERTVLGDRIDSDILKVLDKWRKQ